MFSSAKKLINPKSESPSKMVLSKSKIASRLLNIIYEFKIVKKECGLNHSQSY